MPASPSPLNNCPELAAVPQQGVTAILPQLQRPEGYKDGEGAEGTVWEQGLSPWVCSAQSRGAEGRPMAAAAPHREWKAALSCALWGSDGA